jgi:hypothetical protein
VRQSSSRERERERGRRETERVPRKHLAKVRSDQELDSHRYNTLQSQS